MSVPGSDNPIPPVRALWRSSLGRNIAGLFFLVIGLATLGSLTAIARVHDRQEYEETIAWSVSLTELVAATAELGVSQRNPEILAMVARSLDHTEGVAYVRFLDRYGVVLAEDIRTPGITLPAAMDARTTFPGRAVRYIERNQQLDGEVIDLLADVRSHSSLAGTVPSNSTIGMVQLGLRKAPLQERQNELRSLLAMVGLVALGFGLVAALILTRQIVAPVNQLLQATRSIRAGRMDQRIQVHSRNELGELGASFNAMVADLQATHLEIEEHRRTLEEKVEQRTLDLERATEDARRLADEAQAASQAKSQFLANMSHEIRTPMNGVLGMLEVLGRTQLDAGQRRYVGVAANSAHALLQVISDILDFSKVEAGKLNVHPVDFDLRALIEDVGEILAPQAHAKGVELACAIPADLPIWVRGDNSRVRQILMNLAGNAVKFNEAGEVVIQARAVRFSGEDAVIRIDVRDTGLGITPEVLQRLFNPFVQADTSMTRKYGGTGLGLAIARQLAGLMGGTLTAESTPGTGSTFTLTLPFKVVRPHAVTQPIELRGRRVLVVDDNATNCEIVADQAGNWGMTAETVRDGASALSRLDGRHGPPVDIVMLDMMMPSMDGLELARRIRQQPALADVPLMLLTSVIAPEGAVAEAVDLIVSKPIRSDHLRQCVESLLRPDREPVPIPVVPSTRPVSSGIGARILVAEDNAVNQDVARAYLEELGCHATVAGDGEVAVALCREQSFDLVLMDCMMPRLNGLEATAAIREFEASEPDRPRLPIIALTASALQGERERCLAAGMDDFLPKPLPLNELRAMLTRWLAHKEPARPVESAPVMATPVVPVLDSGTVDQLRRLKSGDGSTLLSKLIRVFTTDSVRRLEALSRAIQQGNTGEVTMIAHTLKSASATLGAVHLSACFAELEKEATTTAPERWAELEAEIREEYARARAALEASEAEAPAYA